MALPSFPLSSSFLSSSFVSTSSSRVRYLRLEKRAREWLRQQGFEVPLARGNEGPEHQYWKFRVAEHYRRLGYEVEVEKELDNGHRVDVMPQSETEQLAVEVEREIKQAIANVGRCLQGGLGRVLVVCVQPQLRRVAERELHTEVSYGSVKVQDIRAL